MTSKIEKGLMLLSLVNSKELTLREARELLEGVTRVPRIIREILEEGERRGIIRREKGRIYLTALDDLEWDFKPEVKRYNCTSRCNRCGRRITVCYYLILGDAEIGPYGCECIKKLRV